MVLRADGSYKEYCTTKILNQGDCFERKASFFLLIANNCSHLIPMFTNIKPNPDLMRNEKCSEYFHPRIHLSCFICTNASGDLDVEQSTFVCHFIKGDFLTKSAFYAFLPIKML